MESVLSVEDLLEKFCTLLDHLQVETALLKSSQNLNEVIMFIKNFVLDISNKICILRRYLDRLKEKNSSLQEESVQSVSNESSHTPITVDNNTEKTVDFGNIESSAIKDCKKALFNEPEYPKISLLKEEEFNNLPKYMIGRQSLQVINGLINSINQVLKAKYSLLSAGKAAARKKGEHDLM
ncbi:PREDICTED: uncharacterized protein LOC107072045 [Polistes dominula]|uniref:SKA complex subunit 1 n=1 Tax=Polistes dominula TaxID=743375 RepID=A0ABM1J3S5_POLDO|nr:PREDICTED: uncharacterized protein LOC107072045 [Polistes dominula]